MKTQAIVPAPLAFDPLAKSGPALARRDSGSGSGSGSGSDSDSGNGNGNGGDVCAPRQSGGGEIGERDEAGGFGPAQHIYLPGNALPARWQGRPRFVVLEAGFGLGHNFLATWLAWRQDTARCERLVFIAVDKHPVLREALERAHVACTAPELSQALLSAWPPLTHDLHTLAFDDGRVTLMLALGDLATWLPELVASVDAFYLGGIAPVRDVELWDARVFKACARLGAPGATAATGSTARSVREGLAAAGFAVERAPGSASRREMTIAVLRPLPRHPPAPGRRAASACRSALVVGSGLAGAAAADALARQGLQVTVLERRSGPAQETSGNVAGLFHGVLHPQDGAHAQLLRAAALRAAQVYRPLIERGLVTGAMQGLLREVPDGVAASASASASASDAALLAASPTSSPTPMRTSSLSPPALQTMRTLLARQGLPPDHVQALDAAQAGALAGCELAGPAWFYPTGGWLAPAELVRCWLQTEGVRLLTDADVSALSRHADSGLWQALDAAGQVLASADVVVVAAAAQAPALLAAHGDASAWTLQRTRGQVTQVASELAAAHRLPRPHVPLASGGYLVSLPASLGGGLFCGATSQAGDEGAALRAADHAANLAQIGRLTVSPAGRAAQAQTGPRTPATSAGPHDTRRSPPTAFGHADLAQAIASGQLTGRVGWRLACDDRLPLLGAVPAKLSVGSGAKPGAEEGADGVPTPRAGGRQGLEQPRQVPRVAGLYVFTALGSRGITLAPLLAEALAAWVTGMPMPLAASLVDAIDPARFTSRRVRQAGQDAAPG